MDQNEATRPPPGRGATPSMTSSNSATPRMSGGGASSTLADLTACVRRTAGERPPPLVGCSLTVIGDTIYLFGGRLVPTRTMVSTLYALSLRTLSWTLLWPPALSSPTSSLPPAGPSARYFHSAEAWGSKLVVFGGEGYSAVEPGESVDLLPLCTLGDVCVWDTEKNEWEFPEIRAGEDVEAPAPRYAHLAVVSTCEDRESFGLFDEGGGNGITRRSTMTILGGQDVRNTYLPSVNVLDLDEMKWVRSERWEGNVGTYRAVAANAEWSIVPSSPYPPGSSGADRAAHRVSSSNSPALSNGSLGGKAKTDGQDAEEPLVQLSYSERPTTGRGEPILIFSNFNFTQVRRDLDLLSAPVPPSYPLETTSLSSLMTGLTLPPGLRFPTGTIVGRHLLIFGTFLSHAVNNFSIWALDLGKSGGAGVLEMSRAGEPLEWTRVDPGAVLARGSWNRAVGWKNSVVVLGDRERDIAADYDHRQTNFAHVCLVDLEAFGIYQPPPQPLPPAAQAFGLQTLSQPFLSDFEITTSDGRRLGCSRKVLENRWPWFRERMDEFKLRAHGLLAAQQKRTESQADSERVGSPLRLTPEPRLTPRTLDLPETAPVVQAFLQYLYTHTLCTPLQLSLPVLSALLIFARSYNEASLRALVVHALHEALGTGQWAAAAIYESATLGNCQALQIRALKLMISGGPGSSGGQSRPGQSEGSAETTPSGRDQQTSTATGAPPSAPAPGVLSSRAPRLSSNHRTRNEGAPPDQCASTYTPFAGTTDRWSSSAPPAGASPGPPVIPVPITRHRRPSDGTDDAPSSPLPRWTPSSSPRVEYTRPRASSLATSPSETTGSDFEDFFGSPRSFASTGASSLPSFERKGSRGLVPAFLEPQVEVEEPEEAPSTPGRPPTLFAYNITPAGEYRAPEDAPPSPVVEAETKARPRLSLASSLSSSKPKKVKSPKEPASQWRPLGFYDTVSGYRDPKLAGVATVISPEAIAAAMSSVGGQALGDTTFFEPMSRSASAPGIPSEAHRKRRHSLDPSTTSSRRASIGSLRSTRSLTSLATSAPSVHSARWQDDFDSVPAAAFLARGSVSSDGRASIMTGVSRPAVGPRKSDGSVSLQRVNSANRSTHSSHSAESKAPSAFSPSGLFKSRKAYDEAARREVEIAVGARLLRAAGADEDEVALRSRSVGWAALKKEMDEKEKEEKAAKKAEKEAKKKEEKAKKGKKADKGSADYFDGSYSGESKIYDGLAAFASSRVTMRVD